MTQSPVQRYRPRRRSNSLLIGCLAFGGVFSVLACVLVLLLIPVLPNLLLQAAGAEVVGDTATILQQEAAPTVQVPQIQNPVAPTQITIILGDYGSEVLQGSTGEYNTTVGSDAAGNAVATVAFTEAGVNTLCREINPICRDGTEQFRNVNIDLRVGGAVVYADVVVPQLGTTQRLGVVLVLDGSAQRFRVAGVDLNGALFDVSAVSFVDLTQIEQIGNDVLAQLVLQAGGSSYTLVGVNITDSDLVVVLQG